MGTSRGWRITFIFAWVWKESRHLKITLAVTTWVVELLQIFRRSFQNIFMERDSLRSWLYWRLPAIFSFLLQGFNSSSIITASPTRLESTSAFIILSTGWAQKKETMSLIQKFWLLMQQWREKSSKLYQSQKVQREYRSPTKSLVLIKNSFHLVEIAPRCEKTNNRGMVMEALQSLHQYNKLGSKAKLLSEFSLC